MLDAAALPPGRCPAVDACSTAPSTCSTASCGCARATPERSRSRWSAAQRRRGVGEFQALWTGSGRGRALDKPQEVADATPLRPTPRAGHRPWQAQRLHRLLAPCMACSTSSARRFSAGPACSSGGARSTLPSCCSAAARYATEGVATSCATTRCPAPERRLVAGRRQRAAGHRLRLYPSSPTAARPSDRARKGRLGRAMGEWICPTTRCARAPISCGRVGVPAQRLPGGGRHRRLGRAGQRYPGPRPAEPLGDHRGRVVAAERRDAVLAASLGEVEGLSAAATSSSGASGWSITDDTRCSP